MGILTFLLVLGIALIVLGAVASVIVGIIEWYREAKRQFEQKTHHLSVG